MLGLIDQGTCLEAMSRPLASHVAPCEAVEFVINDGGQPVERAAVSVTPGSEQPAHLPTRWRFILLVVRSCCLPHCPHLGNLSPLAQALQQKESLRDSSDPPFAPI